MWSRKGWEECPRLYVPGYIAERHEIRKVEEEVRVLYVRNESGLLEWLDLFYFAFSGSTLNSRGSWHFLVQSTLGSAAMSSGWLPEILAGPRYVTSFLKSFWISGYFLYLSWCSEQVNVLPQERCQKRSTGWTWMLPEQQVPDGLVGVHLRRTAANELGSGLWAPCFRYRWCPPAAFAFDRSNRL